jgi:SAM-dependent methyltransferase
MSENMGKEILDVCCGGKMWHWDKDHPLVMYIDNRRISQGAVGRLTGHPEWNPAWKCEPTMLGDFTNLPFQNHSFRLVLFDPPHVVSKDFSGFNALKYGVLTPECEQEQLRLGFVECWRVLTPGGTLVFKWAGDLKRVQKFFPAIPIVGTRSLRKGSGLGTRWLIFYKPTKDC